MKADQADILAKYMKEIGKYKILTREEEQELAKKAQKGDKQAKDKLVIHNLRFVVTVVHKYFSGYINSGKVSKLDLIQAGNEGLMRAVKKFDPSRGIKLISYATWWIRAAGQHHLINNYSLVRIKNGSRSHILFSRIQDVRCVIYSRDPEERKTLRQKILEKIPSITPKNLQDMEERIAWVEASIDAPVQFKDENGDRLTLGNILTYPGSGNEIEDKNRIEFLRYYFSKAIECLNTTEKEVIKRRWLGENKRTLREIAVERNLSRERIRQIELNAFLKLRQRIGKEAIAIE